MLMKIATLALILALLFSAIAGAEYYVGYATESPVDVEEVLVFLRTCFRLTRQNMRQH